MYKKQYFGLVGILLCTLALAGCVTPTPTTTYSLILSIPPTQTNVVLNQQCQAVGTIVIDGASDLIIETCSLRYTINGGSVKSKDIKSRLWTLNPLASTTLFDLDLSSLDLNLLSSTGTYEIYIYLNGGDFQSNHVIVIVS